MGTPQATERGLTTILTRIVLAAGGTPGHVYPALAVAEELERRGVDVAFAGTESGCEKALLPPHYPFNILPGRPFHRVGPAARGLAVMAIPRAVIAARALLRGQRASAVLGFGGYAAIGPVLAARSLGIAAAILEPNAVAGMANRLLARFADRIYLGVFTRFDSPRALRTGLPLRRAILNVRRTSRNGHLRVLVIDDALVPRNGEATTRFGPNAQILRASDVVDIAHAYANCDVVIGRPGAGVLAEIAVLGLPAVLVPLADAAEDHQTLNANVFATAGAAIVRKSAEAANSTSLPGSESQLEDFGRRARAFAAPDATRDLVDDLLRLV